MSNRLLLAIGAAAAGYAAYRTIIAPEPAAMVVLDPAEYNARMRLDFEASFEGIDPDDELDESTVLQMHDRLRTLWDEYAGAYRVFLAEYEQAVIRKPFQSTCSLQERMDAVDASAVAYNQATRSAEYFFEGEFFLWVIQEAFSSEELIANFNAGKRRRDEIVA